jgi:hypothetical protein
VAKVHAAYTRKYCRKSFDWPQSQLLPTHNFVSFCHTQPLSLQFFLFPSHLEHCNVDLALAHLSLTRFQEHPSWLLHFRFLVILPHLTGGGATDVGTAEGAVEGAMVGAELGAEEGVAVGAELGAEEGLAVGTAELGAEEGVTVGAELGAEEGGEGALVLRWGEIVGAEVGAAVEGATVGAELGIDVVGEGPPVLPPPQWQQLSLGVPSSVP